MTFAFPIARFEVGDYNLVLDVVDEASGRTLHSHAGMLGLGVLAPS